VAIERKDSEEVILEKLKDVDVDINFAGSELISNYIFTKDLGKGDRS